MSQLVSIQDMLLTNVSNGLFDQSGYLSEKIFPTLDVKMSTGKLGKYGTAHLRIEHDIMGGRGKARRVESITRSTSTYSLERHGLEGLVTTEDYDNVQLPFDAEKDETIGVSSILLQGKEKVIADALTSTTNLTSNTTLSGTQQYSDYANSDPLGDAKTALSTVKANAGVIPNTLILSWEVRNVLKYHPAILDLFKYTSGGFVSDEQLKQVFEVDKMLVAKSTYESAAEGQTSSLGPIWGKHIIYAYLPDAAQTYQKSLGYYVRKQGVGSRKVYKYPVMNPAESTGVQVNDYYQYLLSDVLCAYLIKNAIA